MPPEDFDELTSDAGEVALVQTMEVIADPLGHLSAEQVESIYQRYLQGEKVRDLFTEFSIKTNVNSLLPLLPHLERKDPRALIALSMQLRSVLPEIILRISQCALGAITLFRFIGMILVVVAVA